jgi:RNA-directed DNA polymerase
VTGQQESDDRVVLEGRRKTSRAESSQQGKAVTVSKQAEQLELFAETADSKPKSAKGESKALSPMTMEEIANETNLRAAFKRVAANRGAPGPDRQSVEQVREHLDACLSKLRQSLLDGSYRAGEIRRVWIPKASGGQRGLGVPNVVDRIVQQAVHQVLSPHYEKTFHDRSHGFRPGRSCHTAIKQAKRYLEQGYNWVVDLDLAKFFDEVNHDRLVSRLEQRIQDRRVTALIRQMLRAKVVMPDGLVVASERGTPQGGPLSPLLSNIVLDELDWELERRGHWFVRYADDCNIYVRTERAGLRVMESVKAFLEKRLRLKVNAEKSRVAKPEDRTFLSFKLWRLKSGMVYVLAGDAALGRLRKTLKELTPRNWGRSVMACIQRVNSLLRGWLGYFGICDEKQHAHLGRIDAHIRRRMRALVLRHWKRKRLIVRHLMHLGVPEPLARGSVHARRRSWWALSDTKAVRQGLNNEFFERCGLFSLHTYWRQTHERIWNIGPRPVLSAEG